MPADIRLPSSRALNLFLIMSRVILNRDHVTSAHDPYGYISPSDSNMLREVRDLDMTDDEQGGDKRDEDSNAQKNRSYKKKTEKTKKTPKYHRQCCTYATAAKYAYHIFAGRMHK